MSLTVFQTASTGEYLLARTLNDGDRDPLNPDTYLIPGGCTTTPPPEVAASEAAVLRNGAWEVVEDHRGEAVYVGGTRMIISDLGPLPDGASVDPPPLTADELWEALRAERYTRLAVAVALLDRHRNQVDFGLAPTLTDEQALAWATYAQALRDFPATNPDLTSPDWPEPPATTTTDTAE